MLYKKCVLEKMMGRFQQRRVAWIPESLAKAGNVVSQKIQGDIWEYGWTVVEVKDESEQEDTLGVQLEWKLISKT